MDLTKESPSRVWGKRGLFALAIVSFYLGSQLQPGDAKSLHYLGSALLLQWWALLGDYRFGMSLQAMVAISNIVGIRGDIHPNIRIVVTMVAAIGCAIWHLRSGEKPNLLQKCQAFSVLLLAWGFSSRSDHFVFAGCVTLVLLSLWELNITKWRLEPAWWFLALNLWFCVGLVQALFLK